MDFDSIARTPLGSLGRLNLAGQPQRADLEVIGDEGRTDLELIGDEASVIIEAKKGWLAPDEMQLAKYLSHFTRGKSPVRHPV